MVSASPGPGSPSLRVSEEANFETLHEPDSTGAGSPSTRSASVPARVGRFVLGREIGRGAMGVVLAGYDETLDRKIAIKFLGRGRERSRRARGRMQREAKAMARLSHPNVVQIYEAGEDAGRLYLAMEFVEGATLREWMTAGSGARPWSEVVSCFAAIGRGLAAAHAAGVVHRDFKPENVLVTPEGIPKVTDFGIAGLEDREATEESLWGDVAVPQTVGAVGTPAYMSPEQFLQRPADARSDQFAFCVSWWEALFGERPFAGTTVGELASSVTAGHMRRPPIRSGVPRWLVRICERGLRRDPEQRWPSMEALLAAIRGQQLRRRRRRTGIAAGIGVAVAAAGFGWNSLENRRAIERCEQRGAALAEPWNAAVRAEIGETWSEFDDTYGTTTAERTLPWLDEHAETLRSVATEVCLDTEVRERFDAATAARAHECLDEHALDFREFIRRLREPSATVIEQALLSAATLPIVEPCRDPVHLARRPVLPDHASPRTVTRIREGLARARALLVVGEYAEALEVSREVEVDAAALGWPPFLARVRLTVGRLHQALGHFPEAESALVDAYITGSGVGDWATAATAATALIHNVGYSQLRRREGRTWARLAEVATAWAGDPGNDGERSRLAALAAVAFGAGDYEDAAALHQRALDAGRRTFGPDHPILAKMTGSLGGDYFAMRRFEESRRLFERAYEMTRASLGPEHPDVGYALTRLAMVDDSEGDLARAEDRYQQAIRILEAALGSRHPAVAQQLNNLAAVYYRARDHAQARRLYRRALQIHEEVGGADHPDVGIALRNLSQDGMSTHEEAVTMLERAAGIFAKHDLVDKEARVRAELGSLHMIRNEPKLALQQWNTALDRLRTHGRDPSELAEELRALRLRAERENQPPRPAADRGATGENQPEGKRENQPEGNSSATPEARGR